MEWIWNAITGKTFVLIFANRKKDIYKLLFKKKKIIISFYSILFLHPNWPFGFVGFMIGFLQNGCLPFRCFSVQMTLLICFTWGLPLAVSLLFARDELCSEGKCITVGILQTTLRVLTFWHHGMCGFMSIQSLPISLYRFIS